METLKRFLAWVKHWLWETPVSEPEPEEQYKLKATDVAKEYMVVSYHGQRINMHRSEYPMWKLASRKDKRAMKDKFEKMEKRGEIRFETIEGNLIAIRNKNYEAKANSK
jgi:hypothetical protein